MCGAMRCGEAEAVAARGGEAARGVEPVGAARGAGRMRPWEAAREGECRSKRIAHQLKLLG
jgi:hypothetical protein